MQLFQSPTTKSKHNYLWNREYILSKMIVLILLWMHLGFTTTPGPPLLTWFNFNPSMDK